MRSTGSKMDWTQTITLGGTLIAYMTGMSIFLFRLNKESIEKNEAHWREMFMYMNGRNTDINHYCYVTRCACLVRL